MYQSTCQLKEYFSVAMPHVEKYALQILLCKSKFKNHTNHTDLYLRTAATELGGSSNHHVLSALLNSPAHKRIYCRRKPFLVFDHVYYKGT